MKICIMDGSQSDDRMGAKIKGLLTSVFSVGSKHRASAKRMMIIGSLPKL